MDHWTDHSFWREHREELLREAQERRLEREAHKTRGAFAHARKRPGAVEVRWGLPKDEAKVARLLDLNGMPRWVAFEERFVVAEQGDGLLAAVRYRTEPKRLLLGLLVADPWPARGGFGSGASRLPCTPGREGRRWSWAHARSLRRPTGLARTTFGKRDTAVGEEVGDWIRRDPRGPATSPLRGGGAGGDAWRVHSSRRYSRRVSPPRAWGRGSGTGHAGTQRARKDASAPTQDPRDARMTGRETPRRDGGRTFADGSACTGGPAVRRAGGGEVRKTCGRSVGQYSRRRSGTSFCSRTGSSTAMCSATPPTTP